jgi:hypothetical protein
MADTHGSSGSIIEETDLVESDKPIAHVLGIFTVTVPFGKQYRVFRNGSFYNDLTPGRHQWTDFSPFARYTAAIIDSRRHSTRPILARGLIPANNDLPPCQIEVPLTVTYQLKDIDKLLNTVNPLRQLERLTVDQVATLITQLRYDESRMWVTKLRDELQRYLRISAVVGTGLEVLQVLIEGEPRGQNEADRALISRFKVREEIANDALRYAADRTKLVADAKAVHEAADEVGLSAADLAAVRFDGGDKLIASQVLIQGQRIAAGDTGAPQPLMPRLGQPTAPALGGAAASGAAGPPRITEAYPETTYPGPGRADPFYPAPSTPTYPPTPTYPSGVYTTGGAVAQSADPPTLPGAGGLDTTLFEAEARILRQTYQVSDGKATVVDASGNAVAGYKIMVYEPTPTWELLQFELTPDYPQTPPHVTVRGVGKPPAPWNHPLLANWSSALRLSEVLAAVLEIPAS